MKWTTVLLLIAASFPAISQSAPDSYGVDNWDSTQVQKFLKKAGVRVKLPQLEELKVDGSTLMSIESHMDVLDQLKLSEKQKKLVVTAVKHKQDLIAKAPEDVFEWRSANRRLVDYYILPLVALSPQATLFWMGFFDSTSNIDEVTDKIENMGFISYWFFFWISPSYPLYQMASSLKTSCMTDIIITYSLLAGAIGEFAVWVSIARIAAKDPNAPIVKYLAFGYVSFLMATFFVALFGGLFYYYIWYNLSYIIFFLVPRFINHFLMDLSFNIFIYLVFPCKALKSIYDAVSGAVPSPPGCQKAMLELLDTDGDGKISEAEFLAFAEKLKADAFVQIGKMEKELEAPAAPAAAAAAAADAKSPSKDSPPSDDAKAAHVATTVAK